MSNVKLRDYVTTEQAAEQLGLRQETVRIYIGRGLIEAEKLGNQWLISKSELANFAKNRRRPGNPAFSRN